MNARRILLLPFSLVYGVIVGIYNFLYDIGLLKSVSVKVNTIGIGNLSSGGTGKTPHVEYIVNLLKNELPLAILSRGYGRKTTGFKLADETSNAEIIGDEPMQYYNKFKNIVVSVCENRVNGIQQLLNKYPNLKVVVLDDVFQHRKLKVELNIVLTDYNTMYYDDFILPSGNLREFKTAIKRADVIIVSKSPQNISPYERRNIELTINPKSYQKIFFSYLVYNDLIGISEAVKNKIFTLADLKSTQLGIVLFTGIANAQPLEDFIRRITPHFTHIKFGDHHSYTDSDITRIKNAYETLTVSDKIILTTEKDYNRLVTLQHFNQLNSLPVYYIPVRVEFIEKDKEEFNQLIYKYATRNKIYVGVYKE
jgi:tetraacyldisaccharide 4'-kinase